MKVDIRYLPLVGLLTIPLGFSIGYMSQENPIDRFELVTVPIYNPPNIVLTVPEPEVIIQTVLETETVVETVIETETVVEIQITDSPVLTAIQYVGLNERTDRRELTDLLGVDPTRVAWCAAFVNIILDQHIRDFAATRMADFKVPRKVVILDEIPKGATGKMQRIGMAEKLGLVEKAG